MSNLSNGDVLNDPIKRCPIKESTVNNASANLMETKLGKHIFDKWQQTRLTNCYPPYVSILARRNSSNNFDFDISLAVSMVSISRNFKWTHCFSLKVQKRRITISNRVFYPTITIFQFCIDLWQFETSEQMEPKKQEPNEDKNILYNLPLIIPRVSTRCRMKVTDENEILFESTVVKFHSQNPGQYT